MQGQQYLVVRWTGDRGRRVGAGLRDYERCLLHEKHVCRTLGLRKGRGMRETAMQGQTW
ncbi:hypothetical protein SAMN00790413_04907 [Deinococcus hopiensis KR-140]|uniref:Uncharacterized protein n=1 Tax=Deinococcus hopiensis KR-140 TaxID=695939 RepID=A0A1W1URT6_9DEIO|nr:hypothetical protein SAMN00790413_04907 [Deinococcus hopiensis KR-140]